MPWVAGWFLPVGALGSYAGGTSCWHIRPSPSPNTSLVTSSSFISHLLLSSLPYALSFCLIPCHILLSFDHVFWMDRIGVYAQLAVSPQLTFKSVSFILRELPLISPCETWIGVANARLGSVWGFLWVLGHFYNDAKSPSRVLSPQRRTWFQKTKCRPRQETQWDWLYPSLLFVLR